MYTWQTNHRHFQSLHLFYDLINPCQPSVAFLVATSHLICSANALMVFLKKFVPIEMSSNPG